MVERMYILKHQTCRFLMSVLVLILIVSGITTLWIGSEKSTLETLTKKGIILNDYDILPIDCVGEIDICEKSLYQGTDKCMVECNTTNYIVTIYFGDKKKASTKYKPYPDLPRCECCTHKMNDVSFCNNVLTKNEEDVVILTNDQLNEFIMKNEKGLVYNIWEDKHGQLYLYDDIASESEVKRGIKMITVGLIMIILGIAIGFLIFVRF